MDRRMPCGLPPVCELDHGGDAPLEIRAWVRVGEAPAELPLPVGSVWANAPVNAAGQRPEPAMLGG
jgi:hypothetical protein